MKIAEVFATIQGEGILSGVPSLFIRTSGCNLRCHWCDTPYTSWHPEGEDWSPERLIAWVAEHPRYRHVVITGGEPMLFAETESLTRLLHARGLHITIETAGTVDRAVTCDLMSISPKLANSTPTERDAGRWAAQHERLRYQPEVLRSLMARYPFQLKFVVAEPQDLTEIRAMLAGLPAAPSQVLLMPEGTDPATLRRRASWLVEVCKDEGFRYCPRLHVELYGNRRGV